MIFLMHGHFDLKKSHFDSRNRVPDVMFNDDEKGNAIHITGGKYLKTSVEEWHQVGKDDLDMFSHIIIKLKNGKEVGTRIKKENVGAPHGPPMNHAEAGLQQNTNIDDDFNKV
jgi:hypothetical protein